MVVGYELVGARYWRGEHQGGGRRDFAISESFPLWQRPKQLVEKLRAMIAGSPKPDHLAATMTGELADCFVTKADGVKLIVNALVTAADGRHTRVYLNSGLLVAPQIALKQPLKVAAANWHALRGSPAATLRKALAC